MRNYILSILLFMSSFLAGCNLFYTETPQEAREADALCAAIKTRFEKENIKVFSIKRGEANPALCIYVDCACPRELAYLHLAARNPHWTRFLSDLCELAESFPYPADLYITNPEYDIKTNFPLKK